MCRVVVCSAPSVPQQVFTTTEKAPTRAFTFKTLLRHVYLLWGQRPFSIVSSPWLWKPVVEPMEHSLHSISSGVPLLALQTSGTQPPPSPQARDLWAASAEQNCRDRNSDRKASGWEDWKGLNMREILMDFYPHLQCLRLSLNLNPEWLKNRAICLSYFRPHLFPNQNIFILDNGYNWIIAVKYSVSFMTHLSSENVYCYIFNV